MPSRLYCLCRLLVISGLLLAHSLALSSALSRFPQYQRLARSLDASIDALDRTDFLYATDALRRSLDDLYRMIPTTL
jgi:hypothetical protein